MEPEVAASLSPSGVAQAVFGSKMTFVLEIFTMTATWTVKACLLLLYARLTEGTSIRQKWAVRFVAFYAILTYLLCTFLFVFYWCSPHVYEYWAVPVRISTSFGVFFCWWRWLWLAANNNLTTDQCATCWFCSYRAPKGQNSRNSGKLTLTLQIITT